jgi:hypothetical protein
VEAALWYYEKGVVFECTDWQWLTNERLREADNGAFILAVVRKMLPKGGVVYFDDAGQGDLEREAQQPRGFWGIAPMGVRIAFAHLIANHTRSVLLAGQAVSVCPALPRPARLRSASMWTRSQASTNARKLLTPPSRRFWTMCAVGSVVGWDCPQARRCSSSSKPCPPTRRCATRSWRHTAPFRTRSSPPTRRYTFCGGLRRLITNPLLSIG